MIDRRRFIQLSAAGAIATAASALWLVEHSRELSSGSSSPELYVALFDDRFTASVQYAIAAQRARIRTQPVRNDVTKLWYHDLQLRWKRAPVAIAGLTTHDPFVCLEQMARDHWMRSVCRPLYADTKAHAAGQPQLYSWIIAPRTG